MADINSVSQKSLQNILSSIGVKASEKGVAKNKTSLGQEDFLKLMTTQTIYKMLNQKISLQLVLYHYLTLKRILIFQKKHQKKSLLQATLAYLKKII